MTSPAKQLLDRSSKKIALLIDPDKATGSYITDILKIAEESRVDFIMAGGSLSFNDINSLVDRIKTTCPIPVILFPGNLLQLSHKADAMLLLSLISGRNPELLIGNHVIAAPFLKDIKSKLVATGYILVSCGSKTAVEYISHTEAIPAHKPDIVVATALAGEMLGMKMIYLEAGSGAKSHVPLKVISAVSASVSISVAVGGGITDRDGVRNIFSAGADMIILGNGCEKRPALLAEACCERDRFAVK
jgi:putative glycerol-1-phosphate prenyltransferase